MVYKYVLGLIIVISSIYVYINSLHLFISKSHLSNIYIPYVNKANDEHKIIVKDDFYNNEVLYYKRYKTELLYAQNITRLFCLKHGGCLSSESEMEITYIRIRLSRPTISFEISPHKGYSTVWLLLALLKNTQDSQINNQTVKLFSFDLSKKPLLPTLLINKMKKNKLIQWYHIRGDVKRTLPKTISKYGGADYIFVDAAHTVPLALWVNDYIFSKYSYMSNRSHVWVSVHDVWNTWYLIRKDLKFLPTFEGVCTVQWMALHPHRVINAFQYSALKNKTANNELQSHRQSILGNKCADSSNIKVFQQWCDVMTLYFRLSTLK